MPQKKYPYLNLSLKSMPGERWKPIAGLDDYFLISTYGRIKRLEYESEHKNGTLYVRQEKIIKPEIRWHYNAFKKDYSGYLTTRIAVEGSRYNFSIGRLVYYTFVKPGNYYDFKSIVLYKDEDNFNVRPGNLRLASLSEKQKRIKDFGRSPNPFHKLSAAQVNARHWHMLKYHLKPVSQYNFEGRKLKTFGSIADASRTTGANATGISRTAKGYHDSCGGYIWKYE